LAKRYYDVVHVDLISMAPYCTRLGARKRVLSLNDPLSLTLFDQAQNRFAPLRTRLGALVHALLQVRVDKKLFQMADAVHLVSGHDAEWCRDHLRALSAVQIPVAVRPESLQVVPSADERRGHTLVIVEKLWIHGHLSAVKQFLAAHWLTLRRRHPTARLILIGGRHIPSSFRSFIHGLPGAELYEWVHSLEDLLAGTSIAVFPYSGACGMKNRVLQCMAARNAVVGTSASFSGLPVRNGVEAVIADSHAEIAAGIDRLLNNPDARQEIGNCARRFIEAGYTEERVGRAWEQLYQDVAFAAPIQDSYPVEDKGFGP
jgi:glycosyltransferase involved in cell wall biosynthesis